MGQGLREVVIKVSSHGLIQGGERAVRSKNKWCIHIYDTKLMLIGTICERPGQYSDTEISPKPAASLQISSSKCLLGELMKSV